MPLRFLKMSPLGALAALFASCILMARSDPAEAAFPGPLSTRSRWIVDGYGRRVKLACVNWPSHLRPVLAEGLDKQPADIIAGRIRAMGFNCVRFTWALELPMNTTLGSLTVERMFRSLGLDYSLAGIEAYNPWIVDLPLTRAFQAMLSVFERGGLMVVLDNHITTPGWCCSSNDGNGFFGDRDFNPHMWRKGLKKMAEMARRYPNVIGMSLRNELRGPRSNIDNWYKYMQRGAETVHAANPDVLVILSGLNFDKDLSFLRDRPVNVSFPGKLVFEMHWYSFSDGVAWKTGASDELCGRISARVMDSAGFLAAEHDGGYPMFVSEFGVDMRGTNAGDNKFLGCFLAVAAEQDWDFAVWGLQGSYYLRQGVKDMDETYGLLNHSWTGARNTTTLDRISSLQSPFRGPGWNQAVHHRIIFHPLTGLCIQVRSAVPSPLGLDLCRLSPMWTYTANKTLEVAGTRHVLRSFGDAGKPVELMVSPPHPASQWDMISNSKLHLTTKAEDGTDLCLDVDMHGFVVTNECKCLGSSDPACDPASQWFKLVDSTTALMQSDLPSLELP